MRVTRVHGPTGKPRGRHFARRARRWGLVSASAGAAVALGCVATLTAQEATGGGAAPTRLTASASRAPVALGTGVVDPAVKPYLDPKVLSAVPVGPEKVSKPVQIVLTSAAVTTALDSSGIPEVALQAYRHAASVLSINDPRCNLPWQLVAAIGRVESNHGRFGGAVLLPNGNGTRPIRGIPLDGRAGVALVRDTDGGGLDGDPNFDRAVGSMQFIPSTWAEYGVDGNGDGKRDPNNIFDAALAAGDYLCTGGGNMTNPAQEAAAVRRYNDADEYVRVVLALAASYGRGDAAAAPTPSGALGTLSIGGGLTPVPMPGGGETRPVPPRVAQAPQAEIPAATTSPARTPTRRPTPPARPGPPTPIVKPIGSPSSTAPATTTTTAPGRSPSGPPKHVRVPSRSRHGRLSGTVDVGWAPAMRQVVVGLLTAPKAASIRTSEPAPTPASLLAALYGATQSAGRGTTLSQNVVRAQSYLAAHDLPAICGTLEDFVTEVKAQSGPYVPPAAAGQLVADAQQIEAVLHC